MSQKPVDEQSSSDSLPYTQVHRAVKPKAALLAGKLGVTPQHALGSLVEFWDLCAGDQRDLERILETTPPGEEPAIILAADDVAGRFELASGHAVEPVTLERLGLLEATGTGYRVRGMSRYFAPITSKIANRARASRAGRASALSRTRSQLAVELAVELPVELKATQQGAVSSEHEAVSSDQKQIISGPVPKKPRSKPKPPTQEALPGVPQAPAVERQQSRGELMFDRFAFDRSEHLEELHAQAPDATYGPAQVHKAFRRWFDLWADVPTPTQAEALGVISGAEWRCLRLFEAYLELDWPAKCTSRDRHGADTGTPQPYPFSALCSEKVWGDLAAKLWPNEDYAKRWPARLVELKGGAS